MSTDLQLTDVYRAAHVLKTVARQTELILAPKINPESTIYLKPECLQYTGSFKLRGAYYKISQLSEEEKSHGVIACSAGNHAQGVALGARANGIKAIICLPEGAPISKVEATKKYGADVRLVPGVYDDAYAEALRLRDEHGYTFVHPFDDPLVIAGQGTIGLEIINELHDVEAVIVPVGGGGLISGVAFAIKSINPNVKVYGVQAAGAPSMVKSLAGGKRIALHSVATVAEIVTVTDDEIAAAILAVMEQQKLVAEGAGAVAVAAAMFNKVPIKGKKTVCLVSGGNIDVNMLSRVINRGLIKSGRQYAVTIDLSDKPGVLADVTRVIGELGGNIISVSHERISTDTPIASCSLRLVMETRNNEHIEIIRKGLADAGYKAI
jgi:threonine dehydratase